MKGMTRSFLHIKNPLDAYKNNSNYMQFFKKHYSKKRDMPVYECPINIAHWYEVEE